MIFSYYCYLKGEKNVKFSIADVINHEQYGIKRIIEHTNSYIKKCDHLLILTYERLYNNPLKELKRIRRFSQIEVSEDFLLKAIENSSFSCMRRIETEKGRKFGKSNFLFTRSGRIREGVNEIKKLSHVFYHVEREISKSPVLEILYS